MEVRFDHVTVTLGGWEVCDDVSIEVSPGSCTVLVGANCAGKSSLLRCLYRALEPAGGTVFVDGRDVWQLPGPEAGRMTAAVVQETPAGFDLTVREMVKLGRIPHQRPWRRSGSGDRDAIDRALDRVGLSGFADRSMTSLSGGERQRVMIARAVAQEASVLVLDEPTNHLDVQHQLSLLDQVRRLGVTTIAALHDITLADRYADQVVMLKAGRVVVSGPPLDALTTESIREVFGVEAEFLASGEDARLRAIIFTASPTA